MPASEVDWIPALVALAAGLVAASVLLWRWRRSVDGGDAAEPMDDTPHRDLARERDSLLGRLRAMDASDADDALAAERYELELRAAGVLRALDELPEPETGGETATAASAPSPGGQMSGFLWGAASAAAIAVVVMFASRDATPRNEGGSMTGGIDGDGSSGPVDGPEAAAVARNPDDLDARLDLARRHLESQDLMAVFEETQFVLERVPGHPRALTYQSLVRLAMGQGDMAVQMLEEAIAGDPDLLEPYVHLALVQVKLGREQEADAAIAEAASRHPDEATRLRDLLEELKRAGRDDPSSPVENAHADMLPASPVEKARADVLPPTRTDASGISGTVELAASGPAPSGVLFIIAREVGETEGAPLAVKRIVAQSFPVRFSLGTADSMMGGELPEKLRIEVRLDLDGDPMTRDDADPKAVVEEVTLGRGDLRIVLGKSG